MSTDKQLTRCMVTHNVLPWSACLVCAANETIPTCPFNYAMLARLAPQKHERREGIHVSDLLGCLRKSSYKRIVPPDAQVAYPHQAMTPMLGTLIHEGFEVENSIVVSNEIELAWNYGGTLVVGRTDSYKPLTRTLSDFKTKQKLDVGRLPTDENVLQIKIYANMLMHMGVEVERAELQYVAMPGASQCKACSITLNPYNENALVCPKCGALYSTKTHHLGTVKIPVPLDGMPALDKWITARANHLEESINAQKPADAEPGFMCKYCPFNGICDEAQS